MAVAFLVILGAQTAFAATSYIGSMTISVNVTPVPGEDLPSLHVGYTGDNDDYEVSVPSNSKYEITSAKWSTSVDEVNLGGTYTIKVTLEAVNDYRFNSSYSSSKVTVKNGTFVNAQRQTTKKLIVTVKTKPAKGDLESPENPRWESTRMSSSKLGTAKWEKVDDAAYDVYLYRGSKQIHKVTDLHVTSYDFYPYMTAKGTYTFRVRSIPQDSEISKYASKSGWAISDEVYIDEDHVSSGEGQKKNIADIIQSQEPPVTTTVGWIKDGGCWYFRYPDGTYITDSWARIGEYWYLFDGYGTMLTGWQKRNDTYYYMNDDGQMLTGWLKWGNDWYYLMDDGAMARGWIQLGDKSYYLNESGVMLTDWQKIDDQMFYFYPDGHKAVNEYISGFYVDLNGVWRKP